MNTRAWIDIESPRFSFLMTETLVLEGKTAYLKLIPPGAETFAGSPETFVNFFRVRIDPKKSENTDKVVEFVLYR